MQVQRIIIACLLFATLGTCQDTIIRPKFPDVFQIEVQGVFVKEKEVVELDGTLYYDKTNNIAAYQYTMAGETSKAIFNFNTNEEITFLGVECIVEQIPDDPLQSFFPFTVDEKKRKKIVEPDVIFAFNKAEFEGQELFTVPMIVYKTIMDIPNYKRKNCEVRHYFTKKEVESPICKSSEECESVLIAITVQCKDNDKIVVDHSYNFYRFTPEITDESAFQAPPGVYCNIISAKPFPIFNSYFSFSFDVAEKMKQADNTATVFTTHSEIWYDSDHQLLRIDDYNEKGVITSSRVLDFKSKSSFVIIPIVATCNILPIVGKMKLGEITRLPQFFFSPIDYGDTGVVYVGQRIINQLAYEVWSATWKDHLSDAKVVEEIYFLEIIPDQNTKSSKPYLKISHVDIYTYQINSDTRRYQLNLLEHIPINNFRTRPKVWTAFDIATCFDHENKRGFHMKLNGEGVIQESNNYLQILENLYDRIIEETGVSLLRISEMYGVFDGNTLTGVTGFIIDNTKESGFKASEPGMNKAFDLIKDAASKSKLKVSYKTQNDEVVQVSVIWIEDSDKNSTCDKITTKPEAESSCYSGASMAVAGIVLFVLGTIIGVAVFYVFLKKRRAAKEATLVGEMELPSNAM